MEILNEALLRPSWLKRERCPMVCVPVRCFNVGGDPEQDVKRLDGDLCHRVDMGRTVGYQVVRLHTTKPGDARST